jgi:hypothetical protein
VRGGMVRAENWVIWGEGIKSVAGRKGMQARWMYVVQLLVPGGHLGNGVPRVPNWRGGLGWVQATARRVKELSQGKRLQTNRRPSSLPFDGQSPPERYVANIVPKHDTITYFL